MQVTATPTTDVCLQQHGTQFELSLSAPLPRSLSLTVSHTHNYKNVLKTVREGRGE